MMSEATSKPAGLRSNLQWLMQTFYSTVQLFMKNELDSHASAAAYYFLLSIAPLILAIVALVDTSILNYPSLTKKLFQLLAQFNPQLTESFFRKIGILQKQGTVSTLGLIGFFWGSRLIISSIQSAFSIIFPSPKSRNFVWSTLLSLILVPFVLILLMVSTLMNTAVRFLQHLLDRIDIVDGLDDLFLSISGEVLPIVLILGLIFFCYRTLPVSRPPRQHALVGAALCTLSIFVLKAGFMLVAKYLKYNVVYGSLSAIVALLLWVYLVFMVFFFFAQFVHAAGKVDVFALDTIIAQPQGRGVGSWLDSLLFRRSRRIFQKYAIALADGDSIPFSGGSDQPIAYVHRGTIDIFLKQTNETVLLATLESGQICGELAYLPEQGEMELRARGDAEILMLPPQVFESMLEHNPDLARRIIEDLSRRMILAAQNGHH